MSESKEIKVGKRHRGDVVVLDVSGRLTNENNYQALKQPIQELLKSGRKKLVLNLSNCQYVDRSGIGELTDIFADVANKGGLLRFAEAKGRVAETLEANGFRPMFQLLSERHAVEGFRQIMD